MAGGYSRSATWCLDPSTAPSHSVPPGPDPGPCSHRLYTCPGSHLFPSPQPRESFLTSGVEGNLTLLPHENFILHQFLCIEVSPLPPSPDVGKIMIQIFFFLFLCVTSIPNKWRQQMQHTCLDKEKDEPQGKKMYQ